MQQTTRYSGPGRLGCSRSLTEAEKTAWQNATAKWHEAPPWTPQTDADNEAVRTMLIRLYEDGVSLPTLARTAGWKHSRVAGILHRLREAGRLSGKRRYIAPAKTVKDPFRRDLTHGERNDLVRQYNGLPLHASGARGWKSEEAQTLLALIDMLARDRVALDSIGEALGMKRQAVHQHLTRFRATRQPLLAAIA
jgi:predicted Rossmann fold nucleotide-binding protein DprA/Smf involved in DNA uptake